MKTRDLPQIVRLPVPCAKCGLPVVAGVVTKDLKREHVLCPGEP